MQSLNPGNTARVIAVTSEYDLYSDKGNVSLYTEDGGKESAKNLISFLKNNSIKATWSWAGNYFVNLMPDQYSKAIDLIFSNGLMTSKLWVGIELDARKIEKKIRYNKQIKHRINKEQKEIIKKQFAQECIPRVFKVLPSLDHLLVAIKEAFHSWFAEEDFVADLEKLGIKDLTDKKIYKLNQNLSSLNKCYLGKSDLEEEFLIKGKNIPDLELQRKLLVNSVKKIIKKTPQLNNKLNEMSCSAKFFTFFDFNNAIIADPYLLYRQNELNVTKIKFREKIFNVEELIRIVIKTFNETNIKLEDLDETSQSELIEGFKGCFVCLENMKEQNIKTPKLTSAQREQFEDLCKQMLISFSAPKWHVNQEKWESQIIQKKPPIILASIGSAAGEIVKRINKRLKTLNQLNELNPDFSKNELTYRLKRSEVDAVRWYPGYDAEEEIHAFVDKLNTGQIFQLLKEEGISIFAKKAFDAKYRGLISHEQFATLCLLSQAIDQLCLNRVATVVTITKDRTYRSDIWRATYSDFEFDVYKMFNDETKDENRRILKSFFCFTDLQYDYFLSAMNFLPVSERLFYTFKIPFGSTISWSPMYASICRALESLQPVDDLVNVPNPVYDEKQQFFVLPSFSMFQLYIDIIFGKNAVTLTPFLGKCATGTIRKFRPKRKQVVNVGLKGAEVGEIADGHYAGKLMYSLHDIYHGIRYSMIKKCEQKALAHIDALFTKQLKQDPDNQALKHLQWMLADGELHRSSISNDDAQAFKSLFSRERLGWKPEFIKLVIENMVKEKDKWEKEFHLTKSDLAIKEQHLYDQIAK